jgi:hypothetical protein
MKKYMNFNTLRTLDFYNKFTIRKRKMSPDEIKMFLKNVKSLSNVRPLYAQEFMMLENILLKHPPNTTIRQEIMNKLMKEEVCEGACVKFIMFKNDHRLKCTPNQFMRKKKLFMSYTPKSPLSMRVN